ncbi:MAG: hypothetical protein PUE85_01825 [Firmicutes bacterium]|nr:hypothetical protein [Bacillota bacterium]
MAANTEDTLMIHKNEIVFFDEAEKRHYRLTLDNLKKIVFDNMEVKKFFGLKKYTIEVIRFYVKDDDIPEVLEIREDMDPNFRRFLGGLRSFAEDNKIELEINRIGN